MSTAIVVVVSIKKILFGVIKYILKIKM